MRHDYLPRISWVLVPLLVILIYSFISSKIKLHHESYTQIKPMAVWTNNEKTGYSSSSLLNEQGGDWASDPIKESAIYFSFDKLYPITSLKIVARQTTLNEYWQSYILIGFKDKKIVYRMEVNAHKPFEKKVQVFHLKGDKIDTLEIIGINPVTNYSNGQLAHNVSPGFSQVKFFKE